MSNPTATVLTGRIAYASQSKTTTGNPSVYGILQQRYETGGFQASHKFVCYGSAKEALLAAASKLADQAVDAEQVGPSATHAEDASYSQAPASTSVRVSGYFRTRDPKNGSKDWPTVFVVETVEAIIAS